MPIVRRAYLVAAPAWVALVALGPFAATRLHASTPTHALALAIYFVGSIVCHQRPERSFHAWGAQLPVCARCTGIYIGAVLGVVSVALAFGPANAETAALTGCATQRTRLWIFLSALPTAVTLVSEWTTGVMPSNAIRFVAGLPLGMVVSWLMIRSVEGRVN